jgi:hypothetical protein
MKKLHSLKGILFLFFFNCFTEVVMAQSYIDPDFPFEGDPGDVPAAPIDQWIIPIVVLALVIMYYYNKKTKHSEI